MGVNEESGHEVSENEGMSSDEDVEVNRNAPDPCFESCGDVDSMSEGGIVLYPCGYVQESVTYPYSHAGMNESGRGLCSCGYAEERVVYPCGCVEANLSGHVGNVRQGIALDHVESVRVVVNVQTTKQT